jgi:hypothetical protein
MQLFAVWRALVVVLLLGFISQAGFAQSPSPSVSATPVRNAQAVGLLQQCSQAMGAPNPNSGILVSGEITSAQRPGDSGKLTIELQGYTQMRRESAYSAIDDVVIVNNGQVQLTRNSSTFKVAPWQETYFRPDDVPALVCSLDLARPQMNVSYVGLETVNGTAVHHIQFFASSQRLPDGTNTLDPIISQFDVYLDTQLLTVVKTKRFLFSPNAIENHSDWETYYFNYQSVGGVLMPFHIQHFLAGQQAEDIVISSLQMNASFPTQDFVIAAVTN